MKQKLVTFILLLVPALVKAVENPAPDFFISIKGNTVGDVLFFVAQMLLGLLGLISVFFLIVGGYQYVVSGANEELAESGKKTIRNSIIGLIISILSYTIVSVVMDAFR